MKRMLLLVRAQSRHWNTMGEAPSTAISAECGHLCWAGPDVLAQIWVPNTTSICTDCLDERDYAEGSSAHVLARLAREEDARVVISREWEAA